jgi:transcriptional regulator with XRE-family HTH domain
MSEEKKSKVKPDLPQGIDDGIGIRLKAAREAKGISQIDLHSKTGLSRTVLINYEAGRHKPGTRELRLLCDALEVSPNHLIYGTEDPHTKSESLADAILSMGGAAIMPLQLMLMLVPAILGKDDTRAILVMIESLMKAKSPEGYTDLMGIVEMTRTISANPAIKDPAKIEELFADEPEALKFAQEYRKKLETIQNRLTK